MRGSVSSRGSLPVASSKLPGIRTKEIYGLVMYDEFNLIRYIKVHEDHDYLNAMASIAVEHGAPYDGASVDSATIALVAHLPISR